MLVENINSSIGVENEIIVIDNSENRYSIFEAYNLGVQTSCGEILCFMHDDVKFHTANWGIKVQDHFSDTQTGAIGIAGSPYVSIMPGSWWANGLINENIIIKKEGGHDTLSKYSDNLTSNKKPVVVLDGIFICIKKELFDVIKFDTITYDGFHFYDIDICLQISKMQKHLYCIYDISIEHFSQGNVNQNWIENAFKTNKKWKKQLPLSKIKLNWSQKFEIEIRTLKEFIEILISNGYSKKKSYIIGLQKILSYFPRLLRYKI